MADFNSQLLHEFTKMRSLGIWVPFAVIETAKVLSDSHFSGLRISQIAEILMNSRGKI